MSLQLLAIELGLRLQAIASQPMQLASGNSSTPMQSLEAKLSDWERRLQEVDIIVRQLADRGRHADIQPLRQPCWA